MTGAANMTMLNNYTASYDEQHETVSYGNFVDPTKNDWSFMHPHWFQYIDVIENAPDWFIFGIGAYITVVSICGILGNLCVIGVFLRNPALQTPSNYYIVNLATSDAGFCLIAGFPLMTISCFRKKWTWGQTACEIYAFLAALCGFNSIGTMALIAFDRYRFISRPLEMLYKSTSTRAVLEVAGVWLWSLLCTFPPLVGWGKYVPEGFQVSCTFDYLTLTPGNITYNLYIQIIGFIVPVGIVAGCYYQIVRLVLRQGKKKIVRTGGGGGGGGRTVNGIAAAAAKAADRAALEKSTRKHELGLAKILAVMVILYVVSWTPYALIALFGIVGLPQLVTPYSAEIPVLLAKSSAVWNPVVYAIIGWSKIYQQHERRRGRYKSSTDWPKGRKESTGIELNRMDQRSSSVETGVDVDILSTSKGTEQGNDQSV